MLRIFLFIVLAINAAIVMKKPWVGVVVGYLFVILGPQYIWWWSFQDIKVFKFIILPTFVGFLFHLIGQRNKNAAYITKTNLYMLILWICIIVSYFFGPFVDVDNKERVFSPEFIFSVANKIMIFYFISTFLISKFKTLKILPLAIIIPTIYLVYWANMSYINGSFMGGRMGGPTDIYNNGIYKDENLFAMLFVTGLPFVAYLGLLVKNRMIKIFIWSIVPLGWHAIFLTGSRGGLVGIAGTIFLMAVRSPKKVYSLLMIPLFIIAFQWQGGAIMKQRSATITIDSENMESSAKQRLEAWQAAWRMIKDNPLTGVGVASFPPAFPYYSEKDPKEAHNTLLQISAEWGIVAGLMYILIFQRIFLGLWRNGKILYAYIQNQDIYILFLVNEATLASFFGLILCSLFLSLQIYEIYFYLVLMANSVLYFSKFGSIGGQG